MANPEIVELTPWEWVKVAENITHATIHRKQNDFKYYYTYRDTGTTAPDAITPSTKPEEGIPFFTCYEGKANLRTFNAESASDLYMYCIPNDGKLTYNGKVKVDYSVSINNFLQSFSSNPNLTLAVNMGQVPGYSFVDKFGENPDIDTGTTPEDIWEFGGEYIYDADGTAPIISLVSDSAADTMDIDVQGLDIDGNLVSQIITLNGTTRVALTTPLWRVFRMGNVGRTDIDGTVYCYVGTGGTPGASDVRAIIDNGNNQTLMALYTIPKNTVGYLFRGELGGSRAAFAGAIQCAYYSRRFGKVFRVKKRVDVTNQGASVYIDKRTAPDIVPALTDIKLTVEAVSANNTGVFGTFDILLIDENLFPDSYLTAIGQPGY